MIFRRPNGFWAIDFQDARVGRVAVSARTKKKAEASARERAVRQMVEWGEYGIVERVKSRLVHLQDVEAAVSESDDIRRATLIDALRGSAEDQGRYTLGSAVDRLLQVVQATREESTLSAYRSYLSDAERHFGVHRDEAGRVVTDIDLGPLQESDRWRDWLTAPKPSGGSWSTKTQTLARAVAGRLWREELRRAAEAAELNGGRPALRLNPIKATERPRVRQNRVEFLSPEEWRRLADANAGYAEAVMLALGCLAGLRITEAAYLRVGIDLLLDDARPRIIVQSRRGAHPWKTKTERSVRDIPIPEGGELERTIRAHLESQFAGQVYLFCPDRQDRPFSRRHLTKLMKEAFERAGIEYGRRKDALTFHSLRHTFVSWLVQRDVQAMKIARLIGDRPEQVYGTYGHLFPGELASVMGTVDEIAGDAKIGSTPAKSPQLK